MCVLRAVLRLSREVRGLVVVNKMSMGSRHVLECCILGSCIRYTVRTILIRAVKVAALLQPPDQENGNGQVEKTRRSIQEKDLIAPWPRPTSPSPSPSPFPSGQHTNMEKEKGRVVIHWSARCSPCPEGLCCASDIVKPDKKPAKVTVSNASLLIGEQCG